MARLIINFFILKISIKNNKLNNILQLQLSSTVNDKGHLAGSGRFGFPLFENKQEKFEAVGHFQYVLNGLRIIARAIGAGLSYVNKAGTYANFDVTDTKAAGQVFTLNAGTSLWRSERSRVSAGTAYHYNFKSGLSGFLSRICFVHDFKK